MTTSDDQNPVVPAPEPVVLANVEIVDGVAQPTGDGAPTVISIPEDVQLPEAGYTNAEVVSISRIAADGEPVDATENPAPEPEKWEHPEPEKWEHTWLDFKGDRLAVKIPTKGMVNALMHAGSTSDEFQTKLVMMFERDHISLPSRERVLSRMIDSDDPVYTTGEEFDELTQLLTKMGAERVQKDAEALAAVKK